MPDQERAICRRLREFRLSLGLSQNEFCKLAGLNRTAYASYEYETSQLNYPAAFRILSAFPELSPKWLWGEDMAPMRDWFFVDYPEPEATGLGPRASFSEVYESQLCRLLSSSRVGWLGYGGLSVFRVSRDARGRVAAKEKFARILAEWLAGRKDSDVNEFLDDLLRHGAALKEKFHRDDEAAVKRRLTEMYAIEAKRRLAFLGQDKPLAADPKNIMLTKASSRAKLHPVKSQLDNLLAGLDRISKEPGKKTELAEFLGAPLASVSRWLSGKREPGREITLKMLRWVEYQERQQNTPGSASNTTKGKTQVLKSSYEKPTQVLKKQ